MAQQEWQVEFHNEFAAEVRQLSQAVREKLKAVATILHNSEGLMRIRSKAHATPI
jgi:mRNA-degrading endonuclease RelE of RelBE toxin-antitoxin system